MDEDGSARNDVLLSRRDIERALYCVNELISRRARAGVPVPGWMRDLGLRLDVTSLTSEMSRAGHQFDRAGAGSGDALIGTREAASILGLSSRQVRRLRADLGGHLDVGGRLLFSRTAVTEYHQGRTK